jgi:hypothetical protein
MELNSRTYLEKSALAKSNVIRRKKKLSRSKLA